MQGGKVWEKAGVGVSVVYGTMPPEAYRAATGTNRVDTTSNGNGVRSLCQLCSRIGLQVSFVG